ncbi:ABC transporter permease [Micromonospora sp. WMMD1155]|uniref:ABC transporter permease n=1 Tax=Micromonospora sp. WMMD1155 TaxID=3016094 RepID=UPI00249AF9B0|nr:ABC transporter permease [Micromonospora sp. WMMD1155]WFE53294.1 ABC transporter permease [Micromonospora sp. WMMD1155]
MTATTVTALAENQWIRFALRRSGRLLLSLWVLVSAAFLMIHALPGDPVRAALGPTAPSALVEQRRAQMGLDDPLALQYAHFLGRLITGDLGTSMTSGLPVADVIGDRIGSTVTMAALAFSVALLVAIPLGLVMAVLARSGRRAADGLFTSAGIVAATIPEFLLAVGLVFVFGVQLGWAPVAGRSGVGSYVLPVVALAVGPAFVLARIIRVELLTVLRADYIRTARAKRLPPWLLYLRHALPNALTAALTIGGLLLGSLVAGTVLVENIFAWPGLGGTIVASILAKDYPTVQGVVLVYGAGVLLVNLAVDVVLAVLDPRSAIREG